MGDKDLLHILLVHPPLASPSLPPWSLAQAAGQLSGAGIALGMAYQIRDDVIDIIGDSECTGKPVGGDVRRRKMRLPLIRTLRELHGKRQRKLIDLMQSTDLSNEDLNEALDLITGSAAVDYCISKVQTYCKEANDTMNMLPGEFTTLKTTFQGVAELISSFENGKEKRRVHGTADN